jgi:PhzF family phenazine biosynthesis protein
MKIKTYIVDAFTSERFKGNPAGVCLLEADIDEDLMFSIAKELGLSETAFIRKIEANHFTIRYFSPKMEIPLCGHATLASSKVLFSVDHHLEKIRFTTFQNLELIITKSGENISMVFPIYDTEVSKVGEPLLLALGIKSVKNVVYNKETNILLLEIEDCEVLRNLKPNFEALYRSHNTINGVLVTALSNHENFDFESRYFWPWSGTNEDPVTGGTHTFLAKYWGQKLGKTKMFSLQCSERTGYMEVDITDEKNVRITSVAHIVFEGSIKL